MKQASPARQSRAHRASVLLTATLEFDGAAIRLRLRNLSERGALVEADDLPCEGSSCWFQRKELRLKSRVVWVQGRFAGVAFDRQLNRREVLRNIRKPQPKAQPPFRRPGLTCRPLTPYERKMLECWMAASPVARPGD